MVILCRREHQGQLEESGMAPCCWSWVLDHPVAANRVSRISVTPWRTDSTGEFENLSDEAEELCYSSFFLDLCNTYLEFFSLP